ncbi:hypothetical protein D623_10025190 [Myotis brandtii]|uniref:Uncharacterized protein n=1 Tax=Myotis brandtii TaxID=109478 RepID=S7N179_MYOBR|nr:hypothetical protein D623_10025190 [Myotis brandtii]
MKRPPGKQGEAMSGVLWCARTLHAWCPVDDTNALKHNLHDRTVAALRPANCLQLGAPSGFCTRGLQASEAFIQPRLHV